MKKTVGLCRLSLTTKLFYVSRILSTKKTTKS